MRDPFAGYDQWKTASPYDDCDDSVCYSCGSPLPEDQNKFPHFGGYCSLMCALSEDPIQAVIDWQSQHENLNDAEEIIATLMQCLADNKAIDDATWKAFLKACENKGYDK